ncbi:hypothetical protein [Vallitalea sp.]|jgi:hypothetical protein|nr:hypothetical protein [Vallitalea sp.]MCT4687878.1 hypothetical protein [Vallitalea sp.]
MTKLAFRYFIDYEKIVSGLYVMLIIFVIIHGAKTYLKMNSIQKYMNLHE